MVANVAEVDSHKCAIYGRFLRNCTMKEANFTFWSLFIMDIILLIIASNFFAVQVATQETHDALESGTPEESASEIEMVRSRKRCLIASVICMVLFTISLIVEGFAGLTLAFCHKEDLIFMYWGFFFLLSFGSFIATLGLVLSIAYPKSPPWNVPLGTPVLVFAYIGFAIRYIVPDIIKFCRNWWEAYWHPKPEPKINANPPAAPESNQAQDELREMNACRRSRYVLAIADAEGNPPEGATIILNNSGTTAYYFARLPSLSEDSRIMPGGELPQNPVPDSRVLTHIHEHGRTVASGSGTVSASVV